jgi:Tfp pilus assembly protein PilF
LVKPKHLQLIEEARMLDRADQRDAARSAYERYLALQPEDPGAWSDYGGLLMLLGRLDEAQQACGRALRIDPANLGAMVNSGCVLMQQGRLDEAEGFFRRVLVKGPRRVDARLALAECLLKKGELGPAKHELTKAIEHDPTNESAHQLLGKLFHQLGQWSEYQSEINRYELIVPSSPYVAYERGFLELLFGNLAQGWQSYEARLRVPGLVGPRRQFQEPRWDGNAFPGKTLLLHHEQGFGDTLMFVRYARPIKALGGRVILVAQSQLASLVATCPGVDEVVPAGDPLPPFDLQASLLSLPNICGTRLDSIPKDVPYLDIPEVVPNRGAIAEALATEKEGVRIGLVWTGSSIHKNDGVRSIPPSLLDPLAALTEVSWYGFQPGIEAHPSLPGLMALGPLLSNFSDTAYALSGMDLVITVDTAVAHLAGALGIPVFVLLPYSPDWRWMLGRDDSPWYPSMRLYRQPQPGDWKTVIQGVLTDLGNVPADQTCAP